MVVRNIKEHMQKVKLVELLRVPIILVRSFTSANLRALSPPLQTQAKIAHGLIEMTNNSHLTKNSNRINMRTFRE